MSKQSSIERAYFKTAAELMRAQDWTLNRTFAALIPALKANGIRLTRHTIAQRLMKEVKSLQATEFNDVETAGAVKAE